MNHRARSSDDNLSRRTLTWTGSWSVLMHRISSTTIWLDYITVISQLNKVWPSWTEQYYASPDMWKSYIIDHVNVLATLSPKRGLAQIFTPLYDLYFFLSSSIGWSISRASKEASSPGRSQDMYYSPPVDTSVYYVVSYETISIR